MDATVTGPHPRTLVLGLGNVLLGDEGAGVHAARLLQRMGLPSDVEVVDGGTGGFELLPFVRGKTKVIVVDCVNAPAPPGSVLRLSLDDLQLNRTTPFSAHQGGLQDFLTHVRGLTPVPEVVIFGVVPLNTTHPSTSLSAAVEASMERLLAAVFKTL